MAETNFDAVAGSLNNNICEEIANDTISASASYQAKTLSSGKKFSDYTLLYAFVGSGTAQRGSFSIPVSLFSSLTDALSNAVLGTNTVKTWYLKYDSDTEFSVATDAGSALWVRLYGIKL